MRAFLSKAVDRISGTIVGAVTGIFAGFIPAFYLVGRNGNPRTDAIMLILSPIFFIPMHFVKGAIEGAREGFLAGLTYPKTVNDSYQTERNNNDLCNILNKANISNKIISMPSLLTTKEEKYFQNILKQDIIAPEKQKSLEADFAAYQDYVTTTKCVLTGIPLKEIKQPLVIHINNKNVICEFSAFETLATECRDKQIPISFSKKDKPAARDIITNKQVRLYTNDAHPHHIKDFIRYVRNFLSSTPLINQTLKQQNINPRVISPTLTETPSRESDNVEAPTLVSSGPEFLSREEIQRAIQYNLHPIRPKFHMS